MIECLSLLPLLLLSSAEAAALFPTTPAVPVTVRYNISYGDAGCTAACPSCQCLDIYEPSVTATSAVLFLHGGLWYSGSRAEIAEVCHSLVAGHGIACVTADYTYSQDLGGCCDRASCEETYSQQAMQAVAAVAATSSLLEGVAPSQVYIGGHSAGGHLALLLATAWHSYAPGVVPPAGYIGVEGVSDAPPYCLTPIQTHVRGRSSMHRCGMPTTRAAGRSSFAARHAKPSVSASRVPRCQPRGWRALRCTWPSCLGRCQ
jgi:acetyl esterase/lipase